MAAGVRSRPGAARWLLPAAAAAAAFGYRFLTIGAIENDHFVTLARAHQVVRGALPVRDFFDPGMPLSYLMSAAAAAAFAPTLLTDVVLTLGLFAMAAALVFVLARRASGSALTACAAVAVVVFFAPRAYNSSKVLVHLVAIALAWRYADAPGIRRLMMLAGWTGVAFLVRHDYAVYVGAPSMLLIVLMHRGAARSLVSHQAIYLATTALCALPWLVYVEWASGIAAYADSAGRFVAAEARRTITAWSLPHVFVAAVPVAALAAIPLTDRRRLTAPQVAFTAAIALLGGAAFLRGDAGARLPDVVAVTAVLAAWLSGALPPRSLLATAAAGTVAIAAVSIAGLRQRGYGMPTPAAVLNRAGFVAGRLHRSSPPFVPGELAPLAAWADRCLPFDARLLVAGFAPELPVLARRPFAGGLPAWIPGYYEHDDDVRAARRWLAAERVGVVVMLEGAGAFRAAWPAIAGDLEGRGLMPAEVRLGGRQLDLWVAPVAGGRRDSATGLPCR